MNAEVPAMDTLAVVGESVHVAVLMTCFNRRSHTLACLDALSRSLGVGHLRQDVILVDDGSTDGTAAAVRAAFPAVELLAGDGSLFWCRGMHRAFERAIGRPYDYFLWLNDDTLLHPDALRRLVDCAQRLQRARPAALMVVGSTVDPVSGTWTYGGQRRAPWPRTMTFERVQPREHPERCDTMTGNVVLLDAATVRTVGNLDPVFEHAMGDTDYGLRATRLGVEVWAAPGVHGTCPDNPREGTFADASLPLTRRWRLAMSRKGLPPRSWLVITRRHAGPVWPLLFVWPYLNLIVSALTRRHR